MQDCQVEFVPRVCEAFNGVVVGRPFGPNTIVYKIGGKMFSLFNYRLSPPSVTLKIDPELGEKLRREHCQIKRGYYMNKRHWVTVDLDSGLDNNVLQNLLKQSFDRVFKSLPKKLQSELGLL